MLVPFQQANVEYSRVRSVAYPWAADLKYSCELISVVTAAHPYWSDLAAGELKDQMRLFKVAAFFDPRELYDVRLRDHYTTRISTPTRGFATAASSRVHQEGNFGADSGTRRS
jgi:hypothetical protein